MSIINGILKRTFSGKKAFQPFFNKLFVLSLEGLNVGSGGGDLLQNGEAFAIEYCLKDATNPIVFDVGAQGGGYTKEILRVSQGEANIHSFEPAEKPYRELVTQFGQKATIVKFALGEHVGEAILFSPKNVDGLSSLYQHDERFTLTEKVPVTTIDTYCLNNKIPHITLLKLDVEGHEFACLRGARSMLPHTDFIQFEMSVASRDARVYFKDIFEYLADFKIYRILKNGLIEIKSPEKIAELLYTTNYLAERKRIR